MNAQSTNGTFVEVFIEKVWLRLDVCRSQANTYCGKTVLQCSPYNDCTKISPITFEEAERRLLNLAARPHKLISKKEIPHKKVPSEKNTIKKNNVLKLEVRTLFCFRAIFMS